MKMTICLVLVLSLFSTAQPLIAAGPDSAKKADDPMAILFEVQESRFQRPDDRKCERVAQTRSFENWADQFSRGDLITAEKSWAEVLQALKLTECVDCSRLICIANERTAMRESSSNKHLLRHLLGATEKAVGSGDRFTAVCCRFVALQLEGTKDFAGALKYRKRQRDIFLSVLGANKIQTVDAQKALDKDVALCSLQQQRAR